MERLFLLLIIETPNKAIDVRSYSVGTEETSRKESQTQAQGQSEAGSVGQPSHPTRQTEQQLQAG